MSETKFDIGTLYTFHYQCIYNGIDEYPSFDYVHVYDVTNHKNNVDASTSQVPFFPLPKNSKVLLVATETYKVIGLRGIFLYNERLLRMTLRSTSGGSRCVLTKVE